MLSPSRYVVVLTLVGLFAVGLAAPASAAETAASELVIIPEADTVDGDLYAAGARVVVEGVVDGDLVAFAAEDVVISGEVTGSVTAVAPVVRVDGVIGGSVRATANRVEVSGSVDGDLVGVAATVELSPESFVDGDVVMWAYRLTSAGTIGADVGGTQRVLEIEGTVEGDIDVSVNRLVVTGPLEVGGDLGYRSATEAQGLDQADVGGVIAQKTPLPPNIRVRALGILTRVLVVLGLTSAALLVGWGRPQRTRIAGERARARPWRSWWSGALIILSPLIVAAIAAVIAGLTPASAFVPLLAIFAPLIIALSGVVLVMLLVAGVPAVLAIGRALPGDRGLYGAIALGAGVVGLVWLLPYVGWLVPLVVLPLGLGAWILAFGDDEPAQSEDAADQSAATAT
jgi:cytoskeletal protein CcmA (bactofilin family)